MPPVLAAPPSFAKTSPANVDIKKQFTVYPNPVSANQLNIQLVKAVQGKIQLTLTNIQGRKVYSSVLESAGKTNHFTVRTPSLPGGAYLVQLSGFDINETVRIIIE